MENIYSLLPIDFSDSNFKILDSQIALFVERFFRRQAFRGSYTKFFLPKL